MSLDRTGFIILLVRISICSRRFIFDRTDNILVRFNRRFSTRNVYLVQSDVQSRVSTIMYKSAYLISNRPIELFQVCLLSSRSTKISLMLQLNL